MADKINTPIIYYPNDYKIPVTVTTGEYAVKLEGIYRIRDGILQAYLSPLSGNSVVSGEVCKAGETYFYARPLVNYPAITFIKSA